MEQKFTEKRGAIKKKFQDEIWELKLAKHKLEEANKRMKEQMAAPGRSTGPSVPPRPPTKEGNLYILLAIEISKKFTFML